MNSKIIAAGVVVALCAVALIGVGYAYTATVTTQNNTVQSEYVVLNVTDGEGNAEALFQINLTDGIDANSIKFSTITTNAGTSWFAAGNQTINSLANEKLVISGSNKTGQIDLTLTLGGIDTPAEQGILGTDATITFTKVSGEGDSSIVYKNNGTAWTTSGHFTIGSTYSATINTVAIAQDSAVSGPPVINFTMTLSFDTNVTP